MSENRASLAMSADSADKVLNPNVGQSVLVFFEFLGDGEGGEWSRGTVESVLEEVFSVLSIILAVG